MSKKYVHITYPENRTVSALQVIAWGTDAMSNEVGISDFPDMTLKQAMLVLEHFGLVTFTSTQQPTAASVGDYDIQQD